MPAEEMSVLRTTEQERADFAWDKVTSVSDKAKYKDVIRKFPSMVINNGLGQALAFLLARGTDKKGQELDKNKEHGQLYLHLQEWLCDKKKLVTKESPMGLLDGLVKKDSTVYRHATIEALALATWLKRFAEALAPKD